MRIPTKNAVRWRVLNTQPCDTYLRIFFFQVLFMKNLAEMEDLTPVIEKFSTIAVQVLEGTQFRWNKKNNNCKNFYRAEEHWEPVNQSGNSTNFLNWVRKGCIFIRAIGWCLKRNTLLTSSNRFGIFWYRRSLVTSMNWPKYLETNKITPMVLYHQCHHHHFNRLISHHFLP